MMDGDGISLSKERKKFDINEIESELFSWRTNDSDKYLMAKARVDRLTRDFYHLCFYRESRWRNWKFRMFCI